MSAGGQHTNCSAAPEATLGFSEFSESSYTAAPVTSDAILKDGCTVEGNVTGQSFHTVYIDLEETYTSLKLFLQGHEAEVQTAAPKKTRKTNKDNRVEDLESENEELRRKLAELENAELKAKLAASQKTVTGGKTKPKAKAKPRAKAKPAE
jgi:predicted RNase H-like nuclease (RuvC/YqgF family)